MNKLFSGELQNKVVVFLSNIKMLTVYILQKYIPPSIF